MRHFAMISVLWLWLLGASTVMGQGDGPLVEAHIGESSRVLAWRPDDQQFIAHDGYVATIYDASTGIEVLHLPHLESTSASVSHLIQAVLWSPDNSKILTASSQQIKVWDTETGALIRSYVINGQNQAFINIKAEWHGNNHQLMFHFLGDTQVFILNAEADNADLIIQNPVPVAEVHWSGDKILTTPLHDPAQTLAQLATTNLPDIMTMEALFDLIETQPFDSRIYLWDGNTGNLINALSHPEVEIFDAVWSTDGSRLLTISGTNPTPFATKITGISRMEEMLGVELEGSWQGLDGNGIVRVWDVATGQVALEVFSEMALHDAAWWMSDTKIGATDGTGMLQLWDDMTGEAASDFPAGQVTNSRHWNVDFTRAFAVIDERSFLQDCGPRACLHRVTVYNAAGQEVWYVDLQDSENNFWNVYAVWSNDGRKLLVGDGNGMIQIWNNF